MSHRSNQSARLASALKGSGEMNERDRLCAEHREIARRMVPVCHHGVPLSGAGMCHHCQAEEPDDGSRTLAQEWEFRQERGIKCEPFEPVDGNRICGECHELSDSCYVGGSGAQLCYPCLVAKRSRESWHATNARPTYAVIAIAFGLLIVALAWFAAIVTWGR